MTATKVLSTNINKNSREICIAKSLNNGKRKEIALKSLSGKEKITEIAKEEQVSRKFIYQQKDKAISGIDNAFSEQMNSDEEVLFIILVTKNWIKQVVIALILLCRGSYRGVKEFCLDILGYEISIGSIHNIVIEAVKKAVEINNSEDLSRIRVAGNDELFQSGMPVLGGIDLESNYCYLLANEEHRDGDTWATHLLYAVDKGFNPEYTVADFGKGLRAGQKSALPDVPCFGDVFHVLQQFLKVLSKLEKAAYGSINERYKLEKVEKYSLSDKLKKAKKIEETNIRLFEDFKVLTDWLHNDILRLVGYDFETRSKLYDFILEELKALENLNKKRIHSLYQLLKNQKTNLLMFSKKLDQYLNEISEKHNISLFIIQEMLKLETLEQSNPRYWKLESKLRSILDLQFHEIQEEITKALSKIYRASSAIENLNGRLRSYFSLRHQIGAKYLDLLRFFLNHHKFIRSHHPERVGKSPAELMNGEKHPHWLEMLGFKPKNQAIEKTMLPLSNELYSMEASSQIILYPQNNLKSTAA
jgi:hypothetical protein